jgi:dihydroneopterin aldolase
MGDADRIELRGLRLTGVVGVLAEERQRAQPLEVDLGIEVDLSAAGLSDDLADTVDYGAVCDAVAAVVAAGEPLLLEWLATQVADAVLALDGRVEAVEVAIRKTRPPVPHDLGTSGVRLVRQRRSVR